MHRGIEAHRDEALPDGVGRALGQLRRAAIAGDLAEEAVERHRGEGQRDHAADHRRQHQADAGVAFAALAGSRGAHL
jgi:hypothetical protein